jgi:hypothetical protein
VKRRATKYLESVERRFRDAGFESYELMRFHYSSQFFGNVELVVLLDGVNLRVVKDRSEEVVSIGIDPDPMRWGALHDVEAALGWTPFAEAYRRAFVPVPSLEDQLSVLKTHWDDLKRQLSPDRIASTVARLEQAEAQRFARSKKELEDLQGQA